MVGFPCKVADYIARQQNAILRRWRDRVRSDPTPALQRQRLDDAALDDHLPALLDQLANGLRGEATPKVEAAGADHGHVRRLQQYSATECFWEMTVFRQVILEVIAELQIQDGDIDANEVEATRTQVLDLLDRSVKSSVQQYTDEAERERDVAMRELEGSLRELRQSHEQKDRFLAMLAHELRNPIAPILMSARLLRDFHADSEHRIRACELIERQARHLARLVDDLLDINRIARGKIEIRRQPMDLRSAIQNAIESCTPGIISKAQQLHVNIPTHEIAIMADPIRVVQLMTNVVTNSSKFTGAGGHIWIEVGCERAEATLRIRDTGRGISPEMLPRVFEMFSQADTSLDRTDGGLGVGLWLARRLAELHGGRIDVHSAGLGQGSEFVIVLPLPIAEGSVKAEPSLGAADAEPGIGAAAMRRVLVVEDNPDTRNSLVEFLAARGLHVLAAPDGVTALHLAAQQAIDAYLIDIGLPGMDGFELARRVRQLAGGHDALLLAITGYGTPEDKRRAEEAGFDHHVIKPPDPDELCRLLNCPS